MIQVLQLILLINYIANHVKGECLPDSDKPFTCDDGETCISINDVCNNVIDCPGGDDEGDFCCPDGQTLCFDWSTCINYSQICDGKADCSFAEDEKGCPTRTENPFVLFESKNCFGEEDLLWGFEGDVDTCKSKCLEYGSDCSGFVFVNSGDYSDKCYLRKGELSEPYSYTKDSRDCYQVYSGDTASAVIKQLSLDGDAAMGIGLNQMSFEHVGNGQGVSMVDIWLICFFFIIGILCLGIGVFIGSKLVKNNGKYVDKKRKYVNDI